MRLIRIVPIIVMLALLLSCGPSNIMTPVKFMHSFNTKLQVGHKIYDKFANKHELNELAKCGNVVLRVHIKHDVYDILLSKSWQQIGDTPFHVRSGGA